MSGAVRAGGEGRHFLFRHPRVRAYLLLSPMLFLLGAGVLLPLGMLFIYSLWRKVGFAISHEATTFNYLWFFTHPVYYTLIGKAILYGFIVSLATLALAYPLAYHVTMRVERWKNAFLIAALIPLYTSDLTRIFAWRSVLGLNGFVNQTLIGLGLIDQPLEFLLFSPFSAVLTLIHQYFPFMFLALWAGLETIRRSEIEATKDLGARWFRAFRRVVFPLSLPGVAAGFLFVFVPVTGDYLAVNLMGGPSGVTITNVIVEQFGQADNWPLGAALAVMVLLAGMIVIAVLGAVLTRLRSIRMYFGKA
jgi:spermidine/putrescine transport system permease protein